jgi:hypothetical protein
MKLGGKMIDRPQPETLREDFFCESAASQTSLRNHLPATIRMPIAKVPIKQRIKIPPYNTASIKATVIMKFLLPRASLSRLDRRTGCFQLLQGGFRSRPLRPLVFLNLV